MAIGGIAYDSDDDSCSMCGEDPCSCSTKSSTSCDTCKSDPCSCSETPPCPKPKKFIKPKPKPCIQKPIVCKKDPVYEKPCEDPILLPPYVQTGKLPGFDTSSNARLSLTYNLCLAAIIHLQLWLFVPSEGWVTQGDPAFPFGVRIKVDGMLEVYIPANSGIDSQTSYRLAIQVARKYVANDTCHPAMENGSAPG